MSCWFAKGGKEQALSAGLNWPTDTVKMVLVRLASITAVKAITAATNATPISITCTGHGRSTGDLVNHVQVGGNTNANGHFRITVIDANTYTLQDPVSGANIAGSGAYTSGGLSVPLGATALDNLDDVTAAAIPAAGGTSASFSGKTNTLGILDATNPITLTSVTAPSGGSTCDALLIYKDTGTASTSTLLMLLDQNGGTGLPITPNGGNIQVTFSTGTFKIGGFV